MKTSEETADIDISSLFNVDSSTGPAVKPDELADRDVDSPSPGVLPCSLSSVKVNEAQSNMFLQMRVVASFIKVIVPDVYREKVISFSHDYIGGHLGVQKTLDKIIKYFYWPGIHRQVAQYCKTCETCQLIGKPNIVIPPAPLQPIPVVPEPFTHVIIDVVGPLPKTKKGHLYMLTLMCTTTRYPEAIPLRSITARTVLPALTKFFTLFGIPKIVQSDRGINFVSNIFRQVMSLLGIKQYIASAYHVQSQGALERFHGTFKTMLAKYGHETGNEWDVGLPFLLYAIRCAKQSSLGFSPSELLFGRDIRGPMKLLHESWIDLEHADNLFEYVSKLKENLDVVHRFAQCNLKLSQEKMKENYDKDAVERNFEVGDEVLLFLPVRKCPLQARYKGPFRVIGKRGDLNYVISTPDHRKTKRLVHVNLIKKYHRRYSGSAAKTVEKVDGTVNSLEVVEMQSEDDLDKIPVGNKLKNSDVLANLNSKLCHLSDSQQSDVSELLQEFVEIFGDVPRPTTEAVHHIELVEGAAPVREKPYRMPPHKAAILQKEVTFLLDNHLAEPSKSDWAAPCILVPKGNREYRMCTDYRKLNALTKADNFPLPRIDDLIDSIGKAKIITKLDLMSGYYQMPLSDEAKRVSSFITPSGLYQYKALAAPANRKAVQRFLGIAGYYRRFCPNFSKLAKPLTDLVSPKVKFKWTLECQEAFDKIKSILTSKPVLHGPDFSKNFTINVDASDAAAGAVLMQEHDGILFPVCYMSAKFKKYQRHYSTIEKEAAALLMALEKFDVYVGNNPQKITVYSDHNPLVFVNNMKNKNMRLTRWWLALQPYNLEIKHVSGKNNVIADSLSRPSVITHPYFLAHSLGPSALDASASFSTPLPCSHQIIIFVKLLNGPKLKVKDTDQAISVTGAQYCFFNLSIASHPSSSTLLSSTCYSPLQERTGYKIWRDISTNEIIFPKYTEQILDYKIFIKVVEDFDHYNHTKTRKKQSSSREEGIPQGSVLSPTLFNIAINGLLEQVAVEVHGLAYADDIVLICSRPSALEAGQKIQTAINSTTMDGKKML
ncbi:uncharacterized protein LOC143025779 [Oratosquilla oratoria]|uniref:uncharacterized protein LOC143025779 n=1 Tax=Oratosquilla oratoria TaxID=337810 RepID=UPI003F76673E